MEGIQGGGSRWKSLRERLGFKGIGCCGASWSFKASDMAVRESDDEEMEEEGEDRDRVQQMEMEEETEVPDPGCMEQDPPAAAAAGMNLATALAAERHLRATQDLEGTNVGPTTSDYAPATPPAITDIATTVPGTPLTLRVSLMRLLEEEGDGVDGIAGDGDKEGEKGGGGGGGADGMCCVCMGRRKGAAFIPCGHTFCRVCSRELWLNRGCCPLCNRSILEILDIF